MYEFDTVIDHLRRMDRSQAKCRKPLISNEIRIKLSLNGFRHTECNVSRMPGSKRWPALATWIFEGVPINCMLVGTPFFVRPSSYGPTTLCGGADIRLVFLVTASEAFRHVVHRMDCVTTASDRWQLPSVAST
jgi:hypothetical protein